MIAAMAKGKQYSLIVPYLALLNKAVGEFYVVHEKVKRIYEAWFVVTACLGMYFPHCKRSICHGRTSPLLFIPCMAMISVKYSEPSQLF